MTIFLAILLSLLTLGFIVYPLVRPGAPPPAARRTVSRKPAVSPAAGGTVDDEIEAQVKALRQAPASFCDKCGARVKADDRFCQRCGQRVN
jgi:hypothetical protein